MASILRKLVFRQRWRRSAAHSAGGRLLSAVDFRLQVHRERLRADRRETAFCVLKISLLGPSRAARGLRVLCDLVGGQVRTTDEKGRLGRWTLALLLVDTPEMGGRCVLDRLEGLAQQAGLHVAMDLRCYDPRGFDAPPPEWDGRRLRDVTKRTVDVVGAAVGLVIAAPVIAAAALAVRVSSPGPAFYVQKREGRGGMVFDIYKIRTMHVDAEQRQASLRAMSERDGPAFKMREDPRVTSVGRFLRATCLDELPQLWNVLKGEMSLVGPRPLPVPESRACARWHRRRLDVRPGLTCFWQVNKHAVESFDDWMRLDLAYVDSASLWKDLGLMVRTLSVPIAGRGAD